MWNVWYVVIAAFAAILIGGIWGAATDWWDDAPMGFIVCGSIFAFVFLLIAIGRPINARQEIAEFEYTRQMVTECVESGTDIQNAAVTSSIIEMNQWLAGAKAERDTFGNWSVYSAERIAESFDALTPIIIKNID